MRSPKVSVLTHQPFFWRPASLYPETRVVSRTHEKRKERPLACVVLEDGCDTDEKALQAHLADELGQPDWWLTDEIKTADSSPKTATDTADKKGLRDRTDMVEDDE